MINKKKLLRLLDKLRTLMIFITLLFMWIAACWTFSYEGYGGRYFVCLFAGTSIIILTMLMAITRGEIKKEKGELE